MRLARVALFLLLWCWNQSGPLSIPVQRNEDARVVAKVVRGVLWNKILYRSGNYVCGGLLVTFLVEAFVFQHWYDKCLSKNCIPCHHMSV
jgi:hypothetical protein